MAKTEKDDGSDNEAANQNKQNEAKEEKQADALLMDDFVYKIFYDY